MSNTGIEVARKLLIAYADAIEGDWTTVCGREVSDHLNYIVGVMGKPTADFEQECQAVSIAKDKWGCWVWRWNN